MKLLAHCILDREWCKAQHTSLTHYTPGVEITVTNTLIERKERNKNKHKMIYKMAVFGTGRRLGKITALVGTV